MSAVSTAVPDAAGPRVAAAPIVEATDLAKSYTVGSTQVPALRGVSLRVAAGEFVALCGPSGSGKSTLLNLLGLLDVPDRGRYRLAGDDMHGLDAAGLTRARRSHVGFVFQGFNLVPVLTAAENVEYPLLLDRTPAAERRRRVQQALDEVGLSELAARRPDELSGGQRQRVAIARALVKRPRLVLADEPTANLDGVTAAQVVDLMRQLSRAGGATVLVATHDARLSAHCDRVITLADGVLA